MLRQLFLLTTFFSLFLIVGCQLAGQTSNTLSNYKDDDIVAIVKGKEITINDLRFLYPDEKVLDNVDGYIKQELVLQEAKKMNIDVSEEIDMQKEILMAVITDENNSFGQEMYQFIKSQANKLGLTVDDYLIKYVDITTEQNAYVSAYVLQKFNAPETNDIDEMNEYDERINEYLDELMKENEDDIEVLIK